MYCTGIVDPQVRAQSRIYYMFKITHDIIDSKYALFTEEVDLYFSLIRNGNDIPVKKTALKWSGNDLNSKKIQK